MSQGVFYTKIKNELSYGSFELRKCQKWAENEPEAIFSTIDLILLTVHTNYQFWYVARHICYENAKWAPKQLIWAQ